MFLRYNTATEIDFFMPDDSDPWSGKTGLSSITVQFKKQGQNSLSTLSSPTITEIGNGWYKLSVPTTLVDTYGFLVIRFSATGAKTQQQLYQVVAFNPYDSNMGLSNLDVAVSSRATAADVWGHSNRTLTSFGTLVNDVANAVWSYTVEAGQSALAWLRLVGAALFGKLTRSGSSYAFRDWNDSKNRIVGSVDDAGNRTIASRDGS